MIIFLCSITSDTSALGMTNPGETVRVSISSENIQGDQYAWKPKISSNGRYIVFESEATTLVENDENGYGDIFVFDTETQTTQLVSVNSEGEQVNYHAEYPAISGNGRFIAFVSRATNLGETVSGTYYHIYVHDMVSGETKLISESSDGTLANAISHYPSLSFDGNLIVFQSTATNLISEGTDGTKHVYIHNLETGETSLISLNSDNIPANHEAEYPSISSDGRYVSFSSDATNLVENDNNDVADIYVRDLLEETTVRVSVASNGWEGNDHSYSFSAISENGIYVAFQSSANNLVDYDTNDSVDIFVHNLITKETERVSINSLGDEAIENCIFPSISNDGRFVSFQSYSWNLVSGDNNSSIDVFIHDRQTNITKRVSINSEGIQGNGPSSNISITPDGFFAVFQSSATNLIDDDTNGYDDIFLHDNRVYAEITSENFVTFNSEQEISFTVVTNGFPAPSISINGVLPSGIEIVDNGDGTATISGIPNQCDGGDYILIVQADNGIEPKAEQIFTLTVESDVVCIFLPLLTK